MRTKRLIPLFAFILSLNSVLADSLLRSVPQRIFQIGKFIFDDLPRAGGIYYYKFLILLLVFILLKQLIGLALKDPKTVNIVSLIIAFMSSAMIPDNVIEYILIQYAFVVAAVVIFLPLLLGFLVSRNIEIPLLKTGIYGVIGFMAIAGAGIMAQDFYGEMGDIIDAMWWGGAITLIFAMFYLLASFGLGMGGGPVGAVLGGLGSLAAAGLGKIPGIGGAIKKGGRGLGSVLGNRWRGLKNIAGNAKDLKYKRREKAWENSGETKNALAAGTGEQFENVMKIAREKYGDQIKEIETRMDEMKKDMKEFEGMFEGIKDSGSEFIAKMVEEYRKHSNDENPSMHSLAPPGFEFPEEWENYYKKLEEAVKLAQKIESFAEEKMMTGKYLTYVETDKLEEFSAAAQKFLSKWGSMLFAHNDAMVRFGKWGQE